MFVQYSPLICSLVFHGLLPTLNLGLKSSRNKQFTRFKLHAVLSSVMKSHAVLPCLFHPRCESSLCPAYPHCIHSPPVSHSVAALIIRLTVFQCSSSSNPLFYLIMARRARIVMLGIWICHGEAIKYFIEVKR